MTFDINKFDNADLQPRTEEIEVEELKSFFAEGEKPIWKVKSLTGEEVARVNMAVESNREVAALIQGILSADVDEKIQAIKEAIGISDEVPDDLARRIALLKYGSVDPVCSQSMAVKLAKGFPTVLYQLTTKILQLTGMGFSLGEQTASGQMTE